MTDDQADTRVQEDAVAARIAAQTLALGSIFARASATPIPSRTVSVPLAAVVETPTVDEPADRTESPSVETVTDDGPPPGEAPPVPDPFIDMSPDPTPADMPPDPTERWDIVPWTGMLPALNYPVDREIDGD